MYASKRGLAIFAAVISIIALPAFAADTMSGAQIGKLLKNFNGAGKGFSVAYKGGSVSMKEGAKRYRGTWELKGNTVCSKFKELHHGTETCRTVQSLGDGAYRFVRTDNGKSYVLIQQ